MGIGVVERYSRQNTKVRTVVASCSSCPLAIRKQ
jgi:hypothetical protein